jgi:tRNA pseudouridine13 synthase
MNAFAVNGFESLAYANCDLLLTASIKTKYSDFIVTEELGFDLDGQGEHVCLQIQKRNVSTAEIAELLATVCNVPRSSVGFCGMKDRVGDCTQWFSIKTSEVPCDSFRSIENDSIKIVDLKRNRKKLKIGSHRWNHFSLLLRECEGSFADFETRLRQIKAQGAPNYFGPQRFGYAMGNVWKPREFFLEPQQKVKKPLKRRKRSVLYSAGRGYLFNQTLSHRVDSGSWTSYLRGDVLSLNSTSRYFSVSADQEWDSLLQKRLETSDIHITGCLPGISNAKEKYTPYGEAADIENKIAKEVPWLIDGLRRHGLVAGRRSLRLYPINMVWTWVNDSTLDLRFTLPRGAYATVLLRELCKVRNIFNPLN